MAGATHAEIDEIGFFSPQMIPVEELSAGEVGYLITGIKDVTQLRVGDTLTTKASTARRGRCRAIAMSSRWSSAVCSRSTPNASRSCATRWRS
jgi:translation elongation factor EF-4